jgi:hypothetical protein
MKTANEIIQLQIGGLVMQLAQTQSQAAAAEAKVLAGYELLAECIRSEQLDSAGVATAMQDADFSAWYAGKYSQA